MPPKPNPKAVYEILELVEVVTQDAEKWVKGAGMATTEITDSVERKEKDGNNFKQYINLNPDLEGQPKRHPEYGRRISFKVKIKQTAGPAQLSGVKVKLTFKKTDGPNKSNPGGTVPDIWADTNLTGAQKAGFKKTDGDTEAVITTDDKGWAGPVDFFLSAYGGDSFKITAELDPSVSGAGKKIDTSAEYVVWRKFWYQLTYADGFAAKAPDKAEAAYKEVFAEMVKSSEVKFKKTDLPADLQARTFYPEYMLEKGKGNGEVATVGGNNKEEFTKIPIYDPDTPVEHPLKANLIVCNYQCDPKPATSLGEFTLTSNGQQVVLPRGAGGPIICKPALTAGAQLVVTGEWSDTADPWNSKGTIGDDAIEINSARTTTLAVKVDLSRGTTGNPPVPTVASPIFIRLQMETARGYLGESFGRGQVLCVYRPALNSGQGSEADYNDTVAHELGHMWNQTPEPGSEPKSLKPHPTQYVGHGGSGSHCKHNITGYTTEGNNTQNDVEPSTQIAEKTIFRWKKQKVDSTANFITSYPVKIGTEDDSIVAVGGTHLTFTTSFKGIKGTVVKQIVNWNDSNAELPKPNKGECIMFHSYSDRCTHKFCQVCKPYLQLQDMSNL